jgi:hypothetical protein
MRFSFSAICRSAACLASAVGVILRASGHIESQMSEGGKSNYPAREYNGSLASSLATGL